MHTINLIFLCTSLEPGRDGVGDYTRQLATELIRQGCKVGIVALNDGTLLNEWKGVQTVESIDVPVLRVPAVWSPKQRFERAKEWIDSVKPEWLSLQYVPFGFHDKGFPFGLARNLAELGRGYRWHIMFHELWVGMDKEASLKYLVWGWIQKKLIYKMLFTLEPDVIHTHTQLYKYQLCNANFKVGLLPLPSNIHVPQLLVESGRENRQSKKTISFVLFGSVHHNAPVAEFVNDVSLYNSERGLITELILVGRKSDEQTRWKTAWQKQGLRVIDSGEQPPDQVSKILLNATFGITTTPVALLSKSSAVATMQAHGLPIICVSRLWKPRIILTLDLPTGILDYRSGNLKSYLIANPVIIVSNTLSEVAGRFIQSFDIN